VTLSRFICNLIDKNIPNPAQLDFVHQSFFHFTEEVNLSDICALNKVLGCSTENVLPFLEIARMATCNRTFQYLLSINKPDAERFIKIIIHNISRTSSDSKTHKTAFKVLANMFYFPYGMEIMFNFQVFDFLNLESSNQKGLATLFSNYVICFCQPSLPSQVQFYKQYLQVIYNVELI
jgi:hypothetical protein